MRYTAVHGTQYKMYLWNAPAESSEQTNVKTIHIWFARVFLSLNNETLTHALMRCQLSTARGLGEAVGSCHYICFGTVEACCTHQIHNRKMHVRKGGSHCDSRFVLFSNRAGCLRTWLSVSEYVRRRTTSLLHAGYVRDCRLVEKLSTTISPCWDCIVDLKHHNTVVTSRL